MKMKKNEIKKKNNDGLKMNKKKLKKSQMKIEKKNKCKQNQNEIWNGIFVFFLNICCLLENLKNLFRLDFVCLFVLKNWL